MAGLPDTAEVKCIAGSAPVLDYSIDFGVEAGTTILGYRLAHGAGLDVVEAGGHIESEVTDGGERGALRGPRREVRGKTDARTAALWQFAAETAPLTVYVLHSPPRTTLSRRKHSAGAERGKWRRQLANWSDITEPREQSSEFKYGSTEKEETSGLSCGVIPTTAVEWDRGY